MGYPDALAAADRLVRAQLGEAVTYAPGSGSPVTVSGIFDALYRKVEIGGAGISSAGPAVFLTLSELPSNPTTDSGARVTIRGVTYKPHEVEPDGQGAVMLLLHKTT